MPNPSSSTPSPRAKLPQHPKHTHRSDPSLVRSPRGNDSLLPRRTRRRTPRKLCALAMPPPLPLAWSEDPSRHRRHPSDHTVAPSVDPTEYSHVASVTATHRGGGPTEGMPSHCRIGSAACGPLLLEFRFVVVAAVDGRVVLYRLEDYGSDGEMEEDVLASERRRRMEWREEDLVEQDEEEEKERSLGDSFEEVQEEEDAMERMRRRERCRECVDPLLVVSLPAYGNARYQEEESHVGHLPTAVMTPMIVDMCVTPPGLGLMQDRGSKGIKHDEKLSRRLIGHVAVLMDNGDVHVLEFLADDDTTITDSAITAGDAFRKSVPIVNVILSFRTGYLGATCICMQPIFETASSSPNAESDCDADTARGSILRSSRDMNMSHIRNIRLCIGHECGILECYHVYYSICTSLETATANDRCNNNGEDISSPYSLVKSKSNETPRNNNTNNSNNNNNTPKRNSFLLSAHPAPDAEEKNVRDNFDSNLVNNSPTLFRTLSEPTDPLSALAQKPPWSDSDNSMMPSIEVEMCWRGKLAVPIRSVACPGWSSSVAIGEPPSSLLVLGTMRCQHENGLYGAELHRIGSKSNYRELSPAVSLEVIDAALAQKYWLQMKSVESCKPDARDLCVTLNDCSVWPAAGMEIKDGWTRSHEHSRDTVCGTLGLRNVSITNKICHFVNGKPCFASAASDGTVAISHLNQDGSWGVHHELNQIKLYQRCIGMGAIEYTSSSNDRRRYICCCLRGGTMYLVPVLDRDENALNQISTSPGEEISMFAVPVDPSGEDDGVLRYVQNFASGMAYVPLWQDGTRDIDRRKLSEIPKGAPLKSVALVGWNGGIIDVYEVYPDENRHNEELFRQLVEIGLARKLVEKLLVVNQSHPLITSVLWRDAWYECNKFKDLDVILKGITMVSNKDFASTRDLILSVIDS